jgi:FkbM family methyltransferase
MSGRGVRETPEVSGGARSKLGDRVPKSETRSHRLGAPAGGVRFLDQALIAYGRSFEHPCKIRIVRRLIRHLAAGRIAVRYARATIAIDPADYIGWAIFKTGRYEPASLALAMSLMEAEPGLFIDVGASFGWYTCAVAAIVGTVVVSIEPDCQSCASLRGNIALNALKNVIVFNGGVGPGTALLPMARRSAANSGTTAIVSADAASEPGQTWVATASLDALLDRLVRPVARPVLMKMDIEGFEPEALAGLNFDGPFRPKNILVECDPQLSAAGWGSPENCHAFFAAKGYELLDVLGRPVADNGPLPEVNLWARDRG